MAKAPSATTIGRRLRAAREAIGTTQADVAAALGVAIARVSEYENGKREPGAVTLWKLAKALKTTPDRLLDA